MKAVRIADLKSRLGQHLREVRRGHSLTVLDRDTPIARLVPYGAEVGSLPARRPPSRDRALARVKLPPPLRIRTNIVDLLLDERQGER